MRRQNVSCVMSSTAMSACICHIHESCTGNASDLPAPYRWKASTTRSSDALVSSVVAPGFTSVIGLTMVIGGNSFQRSTDSSSVSAIWVAAWVAPARVGSTATSTKKSSSASASPSTTGSTSPTGVPA